MSRYQWIAEAESLKGLREIKGAATEPRIAGWLKKLRAWWGDDETPWCGTFAAHCVTVAGIKPPSAWYRAKAWATWGKRLSVPCYGCVVVFDRAGGGHVAFVVGRDQHGRLMCIGGNQGDAVSVVPFERTRAIAYRWPDEYDAPALASLPLVASNAPVSRNEA